MRVAKVLGKPMVKGLWNYAIKVADIDRAVDFYVRTLGAEVSIESEVLGCRYTLIRLGATRVILFAKAPYEHLLDRELPLGFLHDVYEVADFDAQIARLEAAGVRFIMPPQTIEPGPLGRRAVAERAGAEGDHGPAAAAR